METKISKSAVMKRAWQIYTRNRNMFPKFGYALSRAWQVEKENAAYRAKKAEEEAWQAEHYYREVNVPVNVETRAIFMESVYGRSGAYSGD